MSNVSAVDWVVIGEFLIALIALIVFVVFYVVSSHGQALRSPEGRHMLHFRAGLITWMVMGIMHNLFESYPLRDLVRVLVVGWVAAAAVEGTVLMVRAQLSRRRTLRSNR